VVLAGQPTRSSTIDRARRWNRHAGCPGRTAKGSDVTELHELTALVKEEMEGAAQLSVPLVAETGIGDNWLETKGG